MGRRVGGCREVRWEGRFDTHMRSRHLDFIIQMQPLGAAGMTVPRHRITSKHRAEASVDSRSLVPELWPLDPPS